MTHKNISALQFFPTFFCIKLHRASNSLLLTISILNQFSDVEYIGLTKYDSYQSIIQLEE